MSFIVASVMHFRASIDAGEYQDFLIEESNEVLEPEIHPARGGGFNVITLVRNVSTEEEANDLASTLRGYSFGRPPREPQIIIRDTRQARPPAVRPTLPTEEVVVGEEEVIPTGETPYRIAYRKTPKFKESQLRYQQSAAGKEAQRRYAQTPEGLERRRLYSESEKGKARRKEFQERQKIERRSYAITSKEPNELTELLETEVRDPTRFLGAEAVVILLNTGEYSKNEAHIILQSLIASNNLVAVRR